MRLLNLAFISLAVAQTAYGSTTINFDTGFTHQKPIPSSSHINFTNARAYDYSIDSRIRHAGLTPASPNFMALVDPNTWQDNGTHYTASMRLCPANTGRAQGRFDLLSMFFGCGAQLISRGVTSLDPKPCTMTAEGTWWGSSSNPGTHDSYSFAPDSTQEGATSSLAKVVFEPKRYTGDKALVDLELGVAIEKARDASVTPYWFVDSIEVAEYEG